MWKCSRPSAVASCRRRAAASTGPAPGAATARTWPCRRRCSATCRRRARPGACARRGPARTPSARASSMHQLQLGRLLDHDEGLAARACGRSAPGGCTRGPCSRCRRSGRPAAPAPAPPSARACCRPPGRSLRRACDASVAGDAAVLVDLDRIDRGVAAGVVPARPCACANAACSLRRRSPRMSGKRTSSGSFGAVGARGVDDLGQRDRRAAARRAARTMTRPAASTSK